MTDIKERVQEWSDAAKTKIAANDWLVEYANDREAPGSHWEMTKKAAEEALRENDFLREGLSLIQKAYF